MFQNSGFLVLSFLFVCCMPKLVRPRPQICKADKYANGCSVPLGMAAPYKEQFTPACNKHDICYGCVSEVNFFTYLKVCYFLR